MLQCNRENSFFFKVLFSEVFSEAAIHPRGKPSAPSPSLVLRTRWLRIGLSFNHLLLARDCESGAFWPQHL